MYIWAGLNRFEPSTDFKLDNVRIGMGCMNLVTVITWHMWVPVTLNNKIVTYVSPMEVLVNGIKIFNGQNRPWLLYHSLLNVLISWVESRIPKWARLSQIKRTCCVEKAQIWCKMQNIMSEVLCANILLKIETSCWNFIIKIQMVCSKYKNKFLYIVCSKAEIFIHVAIQNFTAWLSYTG